MNMNRIFDVAMSVVAVTLVVGLVLPGRQTGAVIRESSEGFSGILRTAQGR